MTHDLIIVGKGIAASAALLALAEQKCSIAVIAPEVTADFKIGETLSPAANEELRLLGVYEDFVKEKHIKAFSSFSSWGSEQLQEKYAWEGKQEAGWYLDRLQFEQFLWKKAQETSFRYLSEKVLLAEREGSLWRIKTQEGTELKAKYILDCSGRAAVVARNIQERKRLDKLVAIYAVLDQYQDEVEPTIASMVESVEKGWFYSSLLPSGRLVVAFFTDSDLIPEGIPTSLEAWKNLLASSEYTARRIESAEFSIDQCPKVTDASTILTQASEERLLTAGDATASFDPLSSHGMTTALWSGRKAAQAVLGLLNGSQKERKEYQQSLVEGIEQYLQDKRRIYALEKRFSGKVFWARRS